MRIQPFIFTWPGQTVSPTLTQLEAFLGPVTVMNSADPVDGWVNLGSDAFFTEQFISALKRFDGDVFFHVQADAKSTEWKTIVERAILLQQRYDWDNFAPFVDYTHHTSVLRELEPGVFSVPVNDCTCWMLHARLVERYLALRIDCSMNKFGWGHDLIMAALAENAIRDHSHTVQHPRRTGYSSRAAKVQMLKMFELLPDWLRTRVFNVMNHPRAST